MRNLLEESSNFL